VFDAQNENNALGIQLSPW